MRGRLPTDTYSIVSIAKGRGLMSPRRSAPMANRSMKGGNYISAWDYQLQLSLHQLPSGQQPRYIFGA